MVQGSWDGSYDDDDDGAEGPAAKALRSLEQQVVLQAAATILSMPTRRPNYAVGFFTDSKKPAALLVFASHSTGKGCLMLAATYCLVPSMVWDVAKNVHLYTTGAASCAKSLYLMRVLC